MELVLTIISDGMDLCDQTKDLLVENQSLLPHQIRERWEETHDEMMRLNNRVGRLFSVSKNFADLLIPQEICYNYFSTEDFYKLHLKLDQSLDKIILCQEEFRNLLDTLISNQAFELELQIQMHRNIRILDRKINEIDKLIEIGVTSVDHFKWFSFKSEFLTVDQIREKVEMEWGFALIPLEK